MAFIKIKNPILYNKWINYYERCCSEMKPFEIRTMAFINSSNEEHPPLF